MVLRFEKKANENFNALHGNSKNVFIYYILQQKFNLHFLNLLDTHMYASVSARIFVSTCQIIR